MLSSLKELFRRYNVKIEEVGVIEASILAISFVTAKIVRGPIRKIVRGIVQPVIQPPSLYYHSRYNDRWNIFNEDWDLLIVLDTCRPDALRQLIDEYLFINKVDTRWSVGSSSSEWVLNTFDQSYEEEISNTSYVTSNPYSWRVLKNDFENVLVGDTKPVTKRLKKYTATSPVSSNALHSCHFLWDPSADYGSTKYPSPRSVTDNVIELDRSDDLPPRIIAHYMPPHWPYIARLVDGEIKFGEKRSGYDAYLDNLRWALNEVSLLLENVNRENVIITADHGQNFRLKSIRNGHTPGMITPAVRRVPWVEMSAKDKRTREPDLEEREEQSMSVEETLEALGYM